MTDDPILTGWKQIAQFLHVSIRTAQRLHKEKTLPIKSVMNNIIMATKDDLQKWVKSCPPKK